MNNAYDDYDDDYDPQIDPPPPTELERLKKEHEQLKKDYAFMLAGAKKTANQLEAERQKLATLKRLDDEERSALYEQAKRELCPHSMNTLEFVPQHYEDGGYISKTCNSCGRKELRSVETIPEDVLFDVWKANKK